MRIQVFKNPEELGKEAAAFTAGVLNQALAAKGRARLILSTGASQFTTLQALVSLPVDWSKVEMFHLDEYVGLPESHPASFRRYLKERFVRFVSLKQAHFVDGEGDLAQTIRHLTREIRKEPIDLALVGIGENAHIAFNDPPADFDTKEAYIVVNLDENCKKQQVGEGWFATVDDVPKQAVTMTVYQILRSEAILSCVPYAVKARAVKLTLENEVTNEIPATILKRHKNVTLFMDEAAAALVDPLVLNKYQRME